MAAIGIDVDVDRAVAQRFVGQAAAVEQDQGAVGVQAAHVDHGAAAAAADRFVGRGDGEGDRHFRHRGQAAAGQFFGLDGGEGQGVFGGQALDRGARHFDALHRGFLGGRAIRQDQHGDGDWPTKGSRGSLVRVVFTACLLRVIVNRVRVCPRIARMDTSRIRAVRREPRPRSQAVRCKEDLPSAHYYRTDCTLVWPVPQSGRASYFSGLNAS